MRKCGRIENKAVIEIEFMELRDRVLERAYANLNDRQREAVFTTEGPLLVLAGAGSGKTTVIVHKIAHLIQYGQAYHSPVHTQGFSAQELEFLEWYASGEVDELPPELTQHLGVNRVRPYHILAITFTNKAANELKQRLEARLGAEGADVYAGTFHSMCVKFLRRDAGQIGYERSFTIYDSADQQTVMKECLKELGIDDKKYPPRAVLSVISNAKDQLISPQTFADQNRSDVYLSTIGRLYQLYQRKLKANNGMDFDDLIVNTVRLLEECPEVLAYYQDRFQYILVDEYQDTNHAQYRLISLLAAKHKNLCVVGDDDQSIYKFRGADIQNILGFEQEFSGCKVIKLEENYRSTQTILDAANHVIQHNAGRKGKSLWTENGTGEKIFVYEAPYEHAEAQYVAQQIRKLDENLNNTVILYRVNAQSRVLEDALLKAAIPYRVLGGLRFYDRKEIKDLTSYLRLIQNHGDTVALRRVINEPKRGIGDATVDKAVQTAAQTGKTLFDICAQAADCPEIPAKAAAKLEQFAQMIQALRRELDDGMGLELFVRKVLRDTNMEPALKAEKTVENQTRLENLEEFISMVQEKVKEDAAITLEELLEEISLISDIDNYDEAQETVTLMTLHSAKGLEFPNVFLVGMEESLFPSARSFGDEEEIEEERRLCYVGITRAKRRLFLTYAKSRTLFGTTKYNQPSRFLSEIPAELMLRVVPQTRPAAPAYTPRREAAGFGDSVLLRSTGHAQPPESKKAECAFSAGDTVRHRKFGIGTVISAQQIGADALLKIRFGDTEKNLMAAYARLEKVES